MSLSKKFGATSPARRPATGSDGMRRRGFIILLGSAAAVAWPAAAEERQPKIGFLSWYPPSSKADLDNFSDAMRQLGYVEGTNYNIEAYFTGGDRVLTRRTARKLVEEPVDILVALATPADQIAKEATSTIPIVMFTANALATGLVPSLAHPGGNLTGVSLLMTDVAGKWVELLREIRPALRQVTFLGSTKDPQAPTFVRETQQAADRLGVTLQRRLIDGPEAIDQALFDAMKRDGSEAVIVQPIFTGYRDRIVPMAMQAGLPVVSHYSVFADAGALITYGANRAHLIRRTAYYVDRILKGAKPADLPVEQPTEFELVINARTAAKLGWTIPQSLRLRADRVIE